MAALRFGYSRDGQPGKLQIVFGLLCAADGCPIAVEVFDGKTADPSTLAAQVTKLKERFGLSRVVLVGDRGMITEARIGEDFIPAGLDWLTALRAPAIQALAADNGPLAAPRPWRLPRSPPQPKPRPPHAKRPMATPLTASAFLASHVRQGSSKILNKSYFGKAKATHT